ncbi:MAG: hypothetical protein NZL94_08385 [Meiothermus sp.]|uniref:hypothetical protein n=1 Tax=Meiothermus sp. TaxID=1955249 RepID=UPI0026212D31|nr:hypothetical protein [Meiothermus sp.]MCS7058879.1 hypothetical protein [Meiothermus sp.]
MWWMRMGLLLGVFLLVACAPRPGGATLVVRLEAPVPLTPRLEVKGPGFERVVERLGETLLEGLAPGLYTLTLLPVEGPDGYRYGGEGARVALEAGARESVALAYQPITGRLVLSLSLSPPVEGFVPRAEVRRGEEVVARVEGLREHSLSLEPGVYTVWAGPPPRNYRVSRESQPVVVQAGQLVALRVAYGLGFGTIEVRVAAPAGLQPRVRLVGPAGPIGLEGSATLERQVVGEYRVEAEGVRWEGVAYQALVVVNPAGRNPFSLEDGATQRVEVRYQPSESAVDLSLLGLQLGDQVRLVLRQGSAVGQVVAERAVDPGGTQVRFEGLPFGTYHLSASGVRRRVYLDAELAADPLTLTTSAERPRATASLSFRVRPGSGQAWVGGNGARDNSGWTANGVAVPGTRRGDDGAFAGDEMGLAPLSDLPQAGLYRLRRDSQGNLYAVYQFVVGQSQNRILRFSRERLEAGQLAESFALRLVGAATGERVVGGATLNNPTDLAFDAEGHLWVVNQASDAIACVRAERLSASGTLSQPNQLWVGELQSPRALAFDREGNLWVAGGYFLPGQQRAYLVRLPRPSCPASLYGGTPAPLSPDVRLELSQPTHPAGAFYQPSALALSPDGASLWVADLGGGSDYYNSNPDCIANGSIDLNTLRETVIKVPLSGVNLQPSGLYRPAQVDRRLTAGPYSRHPVLPGQDPPDRGLQQAADLAFDSRGNLWIAAANNAEIDPNHPCYATAGFVSGTLEQRQAQCANPDTATVDCPGPLSRLLTDRRGRIYVVGAADLAGQAGGLTVVNPLEVLRGPVGSEGAGFTGLVLLVPR